MEVTIEAVGYGDFGGVVETLPAGFSYVISSLAAADVTVSGQEVTFILRAAPTTFTYTVTASAAAGNYEFSGNLRDSDRTDYPIGGENAVAVEAAAVVVAGPANAVRTVSPASVASGGVVQVTIEADGYGDFGGVVETLPAGFSYVISSLPAADVTVSGQEVTFILRTAPTTFTYTVTASAAAGSYDFSGRLRDSNRADHAMADSAITVEAGEAGADAQCCEVLLRGVRRPRRRGRGDDRG